MVLEGDGVRIDIPAAWHGRRLSRSPHLPTLQAASFPLADGDDELGAQSTAEMADGDCFLALVEYLPGSGVRPGRVPFHVSEIHLPLDPTRFAPAPGGAGARLQENFTVSGRAFCVYIAIAGGRLERRRQLPLLDRVLASLRVGEKGDI